MLSYSMVPGHSKAHYELESDLLAEEMHDGDL